ncbi:MFS transporter [Salicibibacter cibarius]|uniref:MFS transporter n=1 Tax=Salicibibacter cibarius TaxID=2743000 RepID=A0A7T6Z476_9BACI|nr:glycoside-pentoside-hexuronide (GPH):cation symporter [Salicibibacter cibarius]QQK76555.1 MFS transporter [Salicibibacter cibarius]
MLEQSNQEESTDQTTPKIEQPARKEMWGYATSAFGIFAIWTLINTFLSYYYTDVAGLAAGAVGTLLLVARLFDGITDLGMGVFIDRTRSKHGSARPWLLWVAVPFGIITVLLFSVPDIGMTGMLVYAYVSYLGFILIYTAVSISYKSLQGFMTASPTSRSVTNTYAGILNFSGALVVTVLSQPLAGVIGWTTTAALYGLIAIVAIIITFRSVKERVGPQSLKADEKVPFILGFKSLLKNKYWVIMTLFSMVLYALVGMSQGSTIYHAQVILENVDVFPILGLATTLPMIIGLFFMIPVVVRIGKRNTALIGLGILITGQIIRFIDPADLTIFLIGTVIVGFGIMAPQAYVYGMINDTIEYGEYKTGIRSAGLINSGVSFGMKVGSGIGLALIGWLLSFGGYVGGQVEQTPLATEMILAINIYIPIFISVILIILLLFYKLDKEHPTIVAELQKRKS